MTDGQRGSFKEEVDFENNFDFEDHLDRNSIICNRGMENS